MIEKPRRVQSPPMSTKGGPASEPRPARGSSREPSCFKEWECDGTVVYVPMSETPCGSTSVLKNM